MSSRSLEDLAPLFRAKAESFLRIAGAVQFEVLIYCTYRSPTEQDELYAIGRTKPGRVVTNAHAGQSAHNYGLAFDGCPTIHGKPLWDEPISGPHWTQYGVIARSAGLEWGGDWDTFKEGPHVQMANWKAFTQQGLISHA